MARVKCGMPMAATLLASFPMQKSMALVRLYTRMDDIMRVHLLMTSDMVMVTFSQFSKM